MLKAAREGNLEELQKLCTINPYNSIRDNHRWTALHHAVFGNHIEVVQFLLEKKITNPAAETYEGETALFLAVEHSSSIDVIKALLAVGRDIVNINNNEMMSPLMIACTRLTLEYVVVIVEAGANINNQDEINKQTALSIAIGMKKYDVIEYLLYNGADCELVNIFGFTPLMQAAFRSHLNSSFEMIMDFTVDINATNRDGMTVLMLAAQAGDYNKIDILLRNGADCMIYACDGTLALSYALLRGFVRSAKRILCEMTDKQLLSVINSTNCEFSILFLALTMPNIDAESITIVEHFSEIISRNAVITYDKKYEGMIAQLIDSYLPRVLEQYPAHAENLLQILLMKGLSFDPLMPYLTQTSKGKLVQFLAETCNGKLFKLKPERVREVFSLLVKYGYNPSIPPKGLTYLYQSSIVCIEEGKLYGLSVKENTPSAREGTTVRSLKELSRHSITKTVKKHNKSTQRYLIAISNLMLPKILTNFLLEINS